MFSDKILKHFKAHEVGKAVVVRIHVFYPGGLQYEHPRHWCRASTPPTSLHSKLCNIWIYTYRYSTISFTLQSFQYQRHTIPASHIWLSKGTKKKHKTMIYDNMIKYKRIMSITSTSPRHIAEVIALPSPSKFSCLNGIWMQKCDLSIEIVTLKC